MGIHSGHNFNITWTKFTIFIYAIVAAPDRYAHLHAHVTRSTVICLSAGVILYPICLMIDVSCVFERLIFKNKCNLLIVRQPWSQPYENTPNQVLLMVLAEEDV